MKPLNLYTVCLIFISAITSGIPVLFQTYELLLCIGLVPLLFALKGLSANQCLGAGLLFGLFFTSISSYWVTDFLENFNKLSPIESLIIAITFWLYSALPYAIACFLFRWLSDRHPRIELFLFPMVLISVNSIYPHLFPPHFSLGLVNLPYLLQGIDITGVYGAEFILLLINTLLYKLILLDQKSLNLFPILIACLLILFWIAYCHISFEFWAKHYKAGNLTRVGIVQPNDPLTSDKSLPPADYSLAYPKKMEYTQALVTKGAELVIWPETKGLSYFKKKHVAFAFQQQTQHLGFDLLFHDMEEHREENNKQEFSSAVLLTKAGHTSIYHKSRLIPIAEYLPTLFNFNWSKELLGSTFGNFITEQSIGDTLPVITSENRTLVPLICYETLFPLNIDSSLLDKARNPLIAVLSNDMWFGQSRATYQHTAFTVLRAIENRLPVIHATNNGPSTMISPTGKILAKTQSHVALAYSFNLKTSNHYKPTISLTLPFTFLMLNYLIISSLVCITSFQVFSRKSNNYENEP